MEGVEVKHDDASGTKGLRLNLCRREAALAPERIVKVFADLGFDVRENTLREKVFVAVRLSRDPKPEIQLNNFRLTLRPHNVTEIKFGIALSLWEAEVLVPNRMQKELNPWYTDVAYAYQDLWKPVRPASSLSHHPAKAEIFKSVHEWIGQVVVARMQLVESGIVRPKEVAR